jgi:hypothetical protein
MTEAKGNLLDTLQEVGLEVDVERDNYQFILVPSYHNSEVR